MSLLAPGRIRSRHILLRMLIVAIIGVLLIIWQRGFLAQVYFENQLTYVGWAINGAIAALFLTGMTDMVLLFFRYAREEDALNRFVVNMQRALDPMQSVAANSVIGYRHRTLVDLHAKRATINHNALAATLVGAESSHLSFPKFVNNVLILTGVFGTIVSLSIALLGASEMITTTSEISGLGTVIHGMTTALSTTMTAIVAYLVFGYFYLKLNDTLTYLMSRIEHVTATVLLPRYQTQEEIIVQDYSYLIRTAVAIAERFDDAQQKFVNLIEKLEHALAAHQQETRHGNKNVDDIRRLLREGFRLHDRESE